MYINRTDKIFVPHEHIGHSEPKDNGTDPSAYETLHSLLRRQLDKLCATEGDTTDVCEDIVGDDQSCGKEEPDHAFEDIVHDEMRLYNDEVKSHVRPCKLGKLETIMAFLKSSNEEHET